MKHEKERKTGIQRGGGVKCGRFEMCISVGRFFKYE